MVVYIYIYLDWNYYNGNKEIKLIFKSLVLMYICNFCFLFYFLICGCWDVSDWGDGDFVGIVFIDKKLGV